MRGSKNALLNHFNKYDSITSMEAFQKYGITRLSARIYDLRELGYDIDTMMVEGQTRFGETTKYAKYIYKGEQ